MVAAEPQSSAVQCQGTPQNGADLQALAQQVGEAMGRLEQTLAVLAPATAPKKKAQKGSKASAVARNPFQFGPPAYACVRNAGCPQAADPSQHSGSIGVRPPAYACVRNDGCPQAADPSQDSGSIGLRGSTALGGTSFDLFRPPQPPPPRKTSGKPQNPAAPIAPSRVTRSTPHFFIGDPPDGEEGSESEAPDDDPIIDPFGSPTAAAQDDADYESTVYKFKDLKDVKLPQIPASSVDFRAYRNSLLTQIASLDRKSGLLRWLQKFTQSFQ